MKKTLKNSVYALLVTLLATTASTKINASMLSKLLPAARKVIENLSKQLPSLKQPKEFDQKGFEKLVKEHMCFLDENGYPPQTTEEAAIFLLKSFNYEENSKF